MNARLRWAALALLIALVGGRLEAAKFLEAPTRMAMTDLNQIMVMEVVDRLEEGRVRCRRLVDIWGEPSLDEVDIRVPPAVGKVEPGERYVVVYTRYRRNRLVRDLRELDPEGARVVELAVIGPALVAESAEIRLLFTERHDESARAEHLAAAMTLVRSEDEQERRFGIAEVGLGQDLRALVGSEEAAVLAAVVTDRDAPDIERELILTAAADFSLAGRGAWLNEAARGILREDDDPELALSTYRPALIQRSLETLVPLSDAETEDLIVRWLPSNSPGVVRAAIDALDRLDPEVAWRHAMSTLEALENDTAAYRVLLEYTRTAPQPWGEEEGDPGDGHP